MEKCAPLPHPPVLPYITNGARDAVLTNGALSLLNPRPPALHLSPALPLKRGAAPGLLKLNPPARIGGQKNASAPAGAAPPLRASFSSRAPFLHTSTSPASAAQSYAAFFGSFSSRSDSKALLGMLSQINCGSNAPTKPATAQTVPGK